MNFTFHNVSINTKDLRTRPGNKDFFTFHNVSINTEAIYNNLEKELTLHSTMFLLIPIRHRGINSLMFVFTFHNVSINTDWFLTEERLIIPLHSTMFLLIRRGAAVQPQRQVALHSTMFLLIRVRREQLRRIRNFTFHNVSINTASFRQELKCITTLHSTMFLLIRRNGRNHAGQSILYIPQCFY